MRKEKLIGLCNKLVEEFSGNTGSFPVDIEYVKNGTQWTLAYNIIKIQFVLTQKEKLMCPASTLFCRIYLGKNDEIYFHIPELIEYLDENDFKCYYFSYIESEERLEKCFRVLEMFLTKHFKRINEISINTKMYDLILEKKIDEVNRLEDIKPEKNDENEKEEDSEMLSRKIDMFEKYVLIPRLAGEYAYREFMRGNYKKAIEIYQKSVAKNNHLTYEKRLLEFIKNLDEPYETILEECAAVLEMEKYVGTKAEGISAIKGMILGEVIFGCMCCVLFLIFNRIAGHDAAVYITAEWYWGLIVAGLPAVFGAIALRKTWAKILRQKDYQKALEFDSLINGNFVNKFSMIAFICSVMFAVFIFLQFVTCNTAFYEDRMEFDTEEKLISIQKDTYFYDDLKEVVYAKGLYNDYNEFIDRPSYLLIFENGAVWDSDIYTSVEVVEQEVLPLLDLYYEEIRVIEARE